ncbi:MAG: nitrophenyl compound nitroreductase subunit ArsF family protein [Candidatus Omnitrophota bacterium]
MKRLCFFLLAVAVLSNIGIIFLPPAQATEDAKGTHVVAYYFHGTFRCYTCHKMEQYSKEVIETNFKDALVSGKLEFKAVNVEERGNEHFAQDYQLYTKSLILSLVKDGKEIKSKNLTKIWEYVSNKQKFFDYVSEEVNNFLKEAQ